MERVTQTLDRFRVHFDRFFSERSMYDDGSVERVLGQLGDHVYEHEGARWLRTSELGDEKDSVLIRSSGEPTYFASDIAYHEDKRERGYDRVINIWGADHHGHVKRMHASWRALGGKDGALELLIMQLVNLMEGGQRARMSKRQGEFVTLDDLIDDIGVDAARFFLLQRSHDTTIDLDLALAREQSNENPVYYCQYAHARIASIVKRAETEPDAIRRQHAASVGGGADQEAARVPGGDRDRGGAARAAPAHDVHARARAGVLGVLPRLQGGRHARGAVPAGAVAPDAARHRPGARPPRGRSAGVDVAPRGR